MLRGLNTVLWIKSLSSFKSGWLLDFLSDQPVVWGLLGGTTTTEIFETFVRTFSSTYGQPPHLSLTWVSSSYSWHHSNAIKNKLLNVCAWILRYTYTYTDLKLLICREVLLSAQASQWLAGRQLGMHTCTGSSSSLELLQPELLKLIL
jgi:hypothetical protein